MTLTARLSVFFLAALALVLAGFSTALYLLAQDHLYGQVDQRLHAALAALSTAAQSEDEEVEWKPQERRLTLGQDDTADQVRWTVHDLGGRIVDRSPNLAGAALPADPAPALVGGPRGSQVEHGGQQWQLLRQCVLSGDVADAAERESPDKLAARINKMEEPSLNKVKKPRADEPPSRPKKKKTQVLVLTAGLALAPVQATLHQLGWSLGGLSVGVCLLAALLGRWVCRRALLPVTRMAEGARSIRADNLDQRLPVTAARDELTELGTAFNELLGRLQESFERQRRFTGDASHQLRTPLAAVLGQIEVALRRERSPDEYREVLATVKDQAGQLRQIVESLLFLARADAESRSPHLEVVDLATWLPEHIATWSAHPRNADLAFDCLAGTACEIRAQQPLLGQLLDNLWDNACKYSPPASPITIRLGSEADSVVLTFADAGPGVAAEELPHIFEPFYRAAPARQQGIGGIGLGLAVAHRIVNAFGGTIEASSQSGYGITFRIRFPKLALDQAEELAGIELPIKAAAAPPALMSRD